MQTDSFITIENFKERTIEGNLYPQIYSDNDHCTELHPVTFDATELVLSLTLPEIQDLANGAWSNEQIENRLVPIDAQIAHPYNPYRVDFLVEGVCQFFNLKAAGEIITNEAYQAARLAHRIGEPKRYMVKVERTVTQSMWLEVQASSLKQAFESALNDAADCDFNDGHTSEATYGIDEVQEIESSTDARKLRPRP